MSPRENPAQSVTRQSTAPMVSIPVTTKSSSPGKATGAAVTVTDKIIEMRVDALADAIDEMIDEKPLIER